LPTRIAPEGFLCRGRFFPARSEVKEATIALQMTPRTLGDVTIVECGGRLVLGDESANLRHLVRDTLTGCKNVVLDLGRVTYIDSSGLGVLAGLFASGKKAGGGVKLANLNPQMKDLLQITKLLTVFEIFERAEDAAASFNKLAGKSAPGEW
jgi:anti-sigma B factor antagonist